MTESLDPKIAELVKALALEAALVDHQRALAERRKQLELAKRSAPPPIAETPDPGDGG